MMNDTIAAIATANATGAVSIIRISGEEAILIASELINKDLSKKEGYTITFGTVQEDNEVVDEVLVSIFRAPKSYTGEDVVEIGCHGGLFITRKILSLCLGKGARLARRGEFTERAFLNGKMDLSQAEGVNDLINATDEVNAKSAMHSLKGSVSIILKPLEEDLTQIISNIEVNIDYPEYDDVHQLTEDEILPKAKAWLNDIQKLIDEAKKAVNIREGIDTVILGRPNVGKSSLLNALLEEDKAIVTDIAGTTRDIVEGTVRLDGITLNLIDTAGIHESNDIVEKIGIDKSLQALEKAELVIVVIDGSEALTDEDHKLLEMTKNKNRIVVYNKNDKAIQHDGISISAINGDVEALTNAIKEKYEKELYLASSDTLNNERQIGLAIQAEQSMKNAICTLEDGMELDLVTIDLENAWISLKEITGKAGKEDLLDEIFSRFCLGK
ncbi:MAG: tRNA uridine-5-carboxymethylaminomethyl(34) synthesis GTPase MnmE [Erysipelotrichaceae bacterium]|nr:tRNA uridine-5-carboxymethylaminomethyl(34) synthesis GTPase MnmE [Erysipelotrichaceae bacterium]MDD7058351.1 tRNA uridine-5-carboxymethylaminomethyl(34) synthesis GTPase MnmE [Erysipelotrichaceae bacterium]MDY3659478.1 tRNA uridine-5-carboxymethylaminomethyl(34) synthesis GTPase MnmE [Bulleidia sp.]